MNDATAQIVEAWNKAYPNDTITAERIIGLREYAEGIQAVIDNGCKVLLHTDGHLELRTGAGFVGEPMVLTAPAPEVAADEDAPPPLAETPAPAPNDPPAEPPAPPAQPVSDGGSTPPPPPAEGDENPEPPAEPPSDDEPTPDTYEVFKGEDGKSWFFHRKAGNGEIVAVSESYKTRKAADEEAHKQADSDKLEVLWV